MNNQIVNRVAQSALITIDISDFIPMGTRTHLELNSFMHQGELLREVAFRKLLKAHHWTQYQNHFVSFSYRAETVVPQWAPLLFATYLGPIAQKTHFGTAQQLEEQLLIDSIEAMDLEPYQNGLVIIKGCSDEAIAESAYIRLVTKLQPIVKKLAFGEACSSVPLYKK